MSSNANLTRHTLKRDFNLSPAQASFILRASENDRHNHWWRSHDRHETMNALVGLCYFVHVDDLGDEEKAEAARSIAVMAAEAKDMLPDKWKSAAYLLSECQEIQNTISRKVYRLTESGKDAARRLREAGYTYELCRFKM